MLHGTQKGGRKPPKSNACGWIEVWLRRVGVTYTSKKVKVPEKYMGHFFCEPEGQRIVNKGTCKEYQLYNSVTNAVFEWFKSLELKGAMY